jgi:hypothetical protein
MARKAAAKETKAKRPPTSLTKRREATAKTKQVRLEESTAGPDKRKFRASASYSQSEAKAWLPSICADLARDGHKNAVIEWGQRDRESEVDEKKYFMTLDPVERNIGEPYVRGPISDVSINRFKEQFGSYSALIRILGACFRLKGKGGEVIIARRYVGKNGYLFPLDSVAERWIEGMIEQRVGRLTKVVRRLPEEVKREIKGVLAEQMRPVVNKVDGMEADLDRITGEQVKRTGLFRAQRGLQPSVDDSIKVCSEPLGAGQSQSAS